MRDKESKALTSSVRQAGKIKRGGKKPSPIFEFAADDIRKIRSRLGKSQSEFARLIGVSVGTLRNWEQGRRRPEGPARALLRVASYDPEALATALCAEGPGRWSKVPEGEITKAFGKNEKSGRRGARTIEEISLKRRDRDAVRETARLLRERFPVEEIILFGSKATGTDDAESDIDLLVLTSRELSWRERDSLLDGLYGIQLRFDVILSPLVVWGRQWREGVFSVMPIHDEVEEQGVGA